MSILSAGPAASQMSQSLIHRKASDRETDCDGEMGHCSTRALWALHGYLEKLGVELHGDAYIFRNRSGARYSVDTLGDDFR